MGGSVSRMWNGDFYSPRIEKIMEERRNNWGMDKVESEVEASRITWSKLSPSVLVGDALAADNSRVFKSLQKRWGHKKISEWKIKEGAFLYLWNGVEDEYDVFERGYEVGKKLAEGGQAELFEPHWFVSKGGYREDMMGPGVIKMFKEGFGLQELQSLLPPSMLGAENAIFVILANSCDFGH